MFSISLFIKGKSAQLAFYVKGFLEKRIPYSEVDLFFWDTMEEWSTLKNDNQQPYDTLERVFWHLLHQVHYWPEHTLSQDQVLREELMMLVNFIEGEQEYTLPLDCIGIRP
jgi:hypothetical protein